MSTLATFLPLHVDAYGEEDAEALAKRTFDAVAHPDGWKLPISAVAVRGLTHHEAHYFAPLVREAVVHFVGGADVRVVPEAGGATFGVVVRSAGYYEYIGA